MTDRMLPQEIDEYRIKVTVRNNLLLSAIEAAGYKSQSDFARAAELHPTTLNGLIALRRAPIGDNGEFIHAAKVIMEVLGACPSDLWTNEQLTMSLKRNTGQTTMDSLAVQAMLENHVETMTLPDPSDAAEKSEIAEVVAGVLLTLNRQEQHVIRGRFGINEKGDDKTLEQIGVELNVGKERVRAIESRAFRKLRHRQRSEVLGPLKNSG